MKKVAKHLVGIQAKLPTWFKMRKDPSTVGARFLNVMSLTLDDVQEVLDYAYNNQYLPTADLGQVDIVYRASIPATVGTHTDIRFRTRYEELVKADSLEIFLTSLAKGKLNHREIFFDNPYYVDYEKKLVYVRKSYDADDTYKEGQLILVTKNATGQDEKTILKLQLHHIWNFFDEFGLLLDTPRLYGESNYNYKMRLINVFRHPASSTERGLYNGIARELGLTKEVKWVNGGEPLIIRDVRVDLVTVYVDDQPWPQGLIQIDDSGRVILEADFDYVGIERSVTFMYGVTLHELHDKEDLAFQRLLFDIDGHATDMLQYYVDVINSKVPIMWDHFVWGVGFWDIADPELSGYGLIPTYYDARFAKWKEYKPQEG